jgi:hypothetical protein
MTNSQTSRKLLRYHVTANLEKGKVDYGRLLHEIARLPQEERYLKKQDRLIAIPKIFFAEKRVYCVAYEGILGLNPLFFNPQNASERIQELTRGEILATKTHTIIDPTNRQAIIEYNHRGAKANDIAKVLESAARNIEGWETLTLEFIPVPAMEFLRAINTFERIATASLRIVRPNPDWTDQYNLLNDLGMASNAQTVEMGASARRGGSLSPRSGIVKLIKDLVSQARSCVKNAFITGNRVETLGLSKISLDRFNEHKKVSVSVDDNGYVRSEEIQDMMTEYLNSKEGA